MEGRKWLVLVQSVEAGSIIGPIPRREIQMSTFLASPPGPWLCPPIANGESFKIYK
jgi:hypothetical protein